MTQIQKLLLIIAAIGTVSLLHALSSSNSNAGSMLSTISKLANNNAEQRAQNTPSPMSSPSAQSVQALIHTGNTVSNMQIVNNIYEGTSGGFYFEQDGNEQMQKAYLLSPMLNSDFDVEVNANVMRTRVTQVFENKSKQWQNGVYVFPLPEDAAVDAMEMHIGERKITGEIQEKQKAKAAFDSAKEMGKSASLVNQIRPNMFVNKIANIAPQSQIKVIIEYQQVIHLDKGRYGLRIPSAISPRYTPADHAENLEDANLMSSAVSHSALSVNVNVNMGMPIGNIQSEHHKIQSTKSKSGKHQMHIRLDEEKPIAKEFVLSWELAASNRPEAAHLTQSKNGSQYGLIQIVPPSNDAVNVRRDISFILDTSGSMVGDAIEQAKAALIHAIEELESSDRFNLIEFNSRATSLWLEAKPANNANKQAAKRFVQKLQASGGTEIADALSLTFDLKSSQASDTQSSAIPSLHQILFITDGSVSNEAQLLKIIDERLGAHRLFTIGIGSAPNTYFMSEAAIAGRGTFTLIGDVSQVNAKMTALLDKIKRPALTDIELLLQEPQSMLEVFPSKIPDVYAGEPITLTYRYTPEQAGVDLESKPPAFSLQAKWHAPSASFSDGDNGSEPAQSHAQAMLWKSAIPQQHSSQTKGNSGLAKQWAYHKIQQLKRALSITPAQGEDYLALQQYTQKNITETALEHELLSDYTSLIAIDDQQLKPSQDYLAMLKQKAAQLKQDQVKALSNKAWSATQMHLPQTSTQSRFYMLFGLVFLALAGLFGLPIFIGHK